MDWLRVVGNVYIRRGARRLQHHSTFISSHFLSVLAANSSVQHNLFRHFVVPTHSNGQGHWKVWQLRLRSRHLRQGERRQVWQLRLRRRNVREGERRQVRQLRLRCRNLRQGIDLLPCDGPLRGVLLLLECRDFQGPDDGFVY
ncbi:hypothetical protein M758_11G016900 [Ceratodon purpureus]|uniref:Uncharacterized protein n=1 Tax=Ceratodon purpureus TaxID=3225 RepID=A0A8T0GCB1_CERPU|nr:hypothetical protein KC19_11G018500 [Ceratodon purpureus]KAG0600220.1 hypothetical protein M758_11G016900 [Ceratodon purpureus]